MKEKSDIVYDTTVVIAEDEYGKDLPDKMSRVTARWKRRRIE